MVDELGESLEAVVVEDPLDVEVDLVGGPGGVIVALEVFHQEVDDVGGVRVVVLAGENALVEVVAGADLVAHGIQRDLPDGRIGLGRALEGLAGEGRLSFGPPEDVLVVPVGVRVAPLAAAGSLLLLATCCLSATRAASGASVRRLVLVVANVCAIEGYFRVEREGPEGVVAFGGHYGAAIGEAEVA